MVKHFVLGWQQIIINKMKVPNLFLLVYNVLQNNRGK